ncbi:MAG: DUF4276 family protein [Desulfovibrionaceae bacterium]|jgi:hypothetical protein|nr:DUF4276 family protein [Desulfovibrionaceae bacterium]
MSTLVFCLEEPSAKAMLEGVLPRLLSGRNDYRFIVFEGKQDMQRELRRKLLLWQAPDSRFIVVRDQDSGDCVAVKRALRDICRNAHRPEALVRIACHQLESFYLGDLAAVEAGLGVRGLGQRQRTKKFRNPDMLSNAPQELERLTGNRYQKVGGSRGIGPHLRLTGNASRSFCALLEGIRRLDQ